MSLTNSDYNFLATFAVHYDLLYIFDVLYKKFTKLLTAPRMISKVRSVQRLGTEAIKPKSSPQNQKGNNQYYE